MYIKCHILQGTDYTIPLSYEVISLSGWGNHNCINCCHDLVERHGRLLIRPHQTSHVDSSKYRCEFSQDALRTHLRPDHSDHIQGWSALHDVTTFF